MMQALRVAVRARVTAGGRSGRVPPLARVATLAALATLAACATGDAPTGPGTTPPPPTPKDTAFVVPAVVREFRGVWIATVGNLDWPSRNSLSSAEQRSELVGLLERASQLGANAVVFQIRVNGERMYAGGAEPWATALAGRTDVDPGYDPLQLAIDSARARGLEVHAWFNPFRAGNASDTARLAPTHFARQRPDLRRVPRDRVTGGGVGLWFDPGEAEVQDHTIAVMADVVQRYDIDALHIDDFFYPYPNANGALVFPDDSTYARYTRGGGTLTRGDWRRDNINRFVQRMYTEVKRLKPWVRVGISPFGIWRPGNPQGVTGLDAYNDLYADSRLWLQRGWVDYLSPQLYWSMASTGQPFAALLDWWLAQNSMGRHIWPGLAAYRVADGSSSAYSASEIVNQVKTVRQRGGASGTILFRAGSVFDNRDNIIGALVNDAFVTAALPPALTWVDNTPPAAPTLGVTAAGAATWQVAVTPGAGELVRWWWVQWRTRSTADDIRWASRLVPATATAISVPAVNAAGRVDGIVTYAVDRAGNMSSGVTWRAP
ncbi:MAG: family 10 glycosylhydrolase [Gemmatimonadetes bacterium]|nr:family 10 glycosylhydrolase [Gemmatimonadota bacterium]